MHFLFLAAQFEFMTWFPTMIHYFSVCTVFTAGPNIKWDVLHDLQFCTDVTHMDTPMLECLVQYARARTHAAALAAA